MASHQNGVGLSAQGVLSLCFNKNSFLAPKMSQEYFFLTFSSQAPSGLFPLDNKGFHLPVAEIMISGMGSSKSDLHLVGFILLHT